MKPDLFCAITQKYINSRAKCIAVQETKLASKHSFSTLFLTLSQSLSLSGWLDDPSELFQFQQFQHCVTLIIMFVRREKDLDLIDSKCRVKGCSLQYNLDLALNSDKNENEILEQFQRASSPVADVICGKDHH